MHNDLIEILVCPKCKGKLKRPANADGYHCSACALLFPIVEGVPVFLLDEALPFSGKDDSKS